MTQGYSRVWLNLAGVKMHHFFMLRNQLNRLNCLIKTVSSVILEAFGADKIKRSKDVSVTRIQKLLVDASIYIFLSWH